MNGNLVESTCIKIGTGVFHKTKIVSQIFDCAYKIFQGTVIQDVLGKIYMAIPYKVGACVNIPIPELDGNRIVDAKYESKTAILLIEKSGIYKRLTLCFSADYSSYTVREDVDTNLDSVNFAVLANGVCVTIIENDRVEIFANNAKVKIAKTPPFDSSMPIFKDGTKDIFSNINKLHWISLKSS